jgi:hypothetical protein
VNLYFFVTNRSVYGVDVSGLVGLFFDGAGQPPGKSKIDELFKEYDGHKIYYPTNVVPNNTWANVKHAHKAVCDLVCAGVSIDCDSNTHRVDRLPYVDIFGWSRGGVAALELARRLQRTGCECSKSCPRSRTLCSWRSSYNLVATIKPIKVRFLGLIDVVATSSGISMQDLEHDTIPDNVANAVHHRRDADYDWLDRNLFENEDVSREDVDATNYEQIDHSMPHSQTGFSDEIKSDIQNRAEQAGVKFTK